MPKGLATYLNCVGTESVVMSNQQFNKYITKIKELNPLVMCITNIVTPQRVADILLASGASPAMVSNPHEIASFAAFSSCVYLNTGLHESQCNAIDEIIEPKLSDVNNYPPFVIDPVGYGATSFRVNYVNKVITHLNREGKLAAIKGNAAEITAIATTYAGYSPDNDGAQVKGKGVDSDANTAAAIKPAKHLAKTLHCIVSISGDSDIIVSADGLTVTKVLGNYPLMSKVTGTGCALGGVVGAAIGSIHMSNKSTTTTTTTTTLDDHNSGTSDNANNCTLWTQRYEAVVAAHYLYTAAAMKAKHRLEVLASASSFHESIHGPGSLSTAFVDELYYLSNHVELISKYASMEEVHI